MPASYLPADLSALIRCLERDAIVLAATFPAEVVRLLLLVAEFRGARAVNRF